MKTTEPPIVVEQAFDASKEKVWKAITEVDQMTKWFFDNIPDFKAEKGFQTGFLVENEGRKFPHRWTIVEVKAGEKIVYDWSYENYPGRGLVTFELKESKGKAVLTLTNEVLEDFPEDVPEFTRENCKGGWDFFIRQNLKEYMEK